MGKCLIRAHLLLFLILGIVDAASPLSGSNTKKDSSTPSSIDNGNVGAPSQVHIKHDILVWFEVLELGMYFSFHKFK